MAKRLANSDNDVYFYLLEKKNTGLKRFTIPCALLKLNDQNYAMSCVARSAPVRRSTRQTRCFSRREGEGHGRRSALLHSASLLTVAPAPLVLAASTADAVSHFGVVADDVNAIEFAYPTTNAEGNFITWFVAR